MIWHRKTRERLDDELRLHRELLIEDLRAQGNTESEAQAKADRQLGRLSAVREEYLDHAPLRWLEMLTQDLQFGLRLLKRSPGFAASAILTLALGVGGATAMFTLIQNTLLRPLPYPKFDRLVVMWGTTPEGPSTTSMPDYRDFRERNRSFSELAAYRTRMLNLTRPGPPDVIASAEVSDNFFEAMRLPPLLGRSLNGEDVGSPSVVISEDVWRNRLGSRMDVLGSTLVLDGESRTVVGVMPRAFDLPSGARTWIPLSRKALNGYRRSDSLVIVGRMRADVTLRQAQAESHALAAALENAYPNTNTGRGSQLIGLHNELTKGVKQPLLMLFAAVVTLLVIACVNIANLVLARGASRAQEILVRASIGATGRRLAAQLSIEAALLATFGGTIGVLLAEIALRGWANWGASTVLGEVQTSWLLDPAVLGFALGATALSALIFGVLPARTLANVDLANGLRCRGAAQGTKRMNVLVALQMALAFVLLACSGLLVRSLIALSTTDPGYRSDSVLMGRVTLPLSYPDSETIRAFHSRLVDDLRILPGVKSVALANMVPGSGTNSQTFDVAGRPLDRANQPEANLRAVTQDYFATIGVSIVSGRAFGVSDNQNAPPVCIVSEALVRRYFTGLEPIGQRIRIDGDDWKTIVGIATDVRQQGLDVPPAPEVIVPMDQRVTRAPIILVRGGTEPAALANTLRRAVRSINPELPLFDVMPLGSLIARVMEKPQFRTLLLSAFSGAALLLSALGVFGVLSYAVSQRKAEIGIRMALGADTHQIRTAVVGGTLRFALVGVAGGMAIALLAGRSLDALLFGVEAYDPVAFGAAAAITLSVCLLAAWAPARRAVRLDPVISLRGE